MLFLDRYMKVNFRHFDDKGENISEVECLDINYADLLRACITVGEPSREYAMNKLLEMPEFAFHKIFAIFTSLDFQNDEIILNPSCDNLEHSEKVVLSFWTGMIFAKIVAERILGVCWPTHVRLMQKECPEDLVLEPPDSKSLPDFIGTKNNEEWHILEAKGLRSNPSKGKRNDYKKQTKCLATIRGKEPSTRNYCITHLQSPIEIELVDPKKDPEVKLKLDFGLKNFQNYYYKNIIEFFSGLDINNKSDQESQFLIKKIPCLCFIKRECYIGIVRETYKQIISEENVEILKEENILTLKNELFNQFQTQSEFLDNNDKLELSIGSDGIFVVIK